MTTEDALRWLAAHQGALEFTLLNAEVAKQVKRGSVAVRCAAAFRGQRIDGNVCIGQPFPALVRAVESCKAELENREGKERPREPIH
jgi:hypothetical protein